jgi:hypothetical protein
MMSSDTDTETGVRRTDRPALAGWRGPVVAILLICGWTAATRTATPRFYPDDPVWQDDDRAFDAGAASEAPLSEGFDFFEHSFGSPGDRRDVRALNVNTLEEVPDSSWFSNRIGHRTMSLEEIERGPDTIDRLDVTDWVVVDDKGPAGFQPGFRARDARDTRARAQWFQLEGDTKDFPELASGSEMLGTFFYHAMGFNVVDTYLVDVDPRRVTIAPGTSVRDASGERPFTQADLDRIFRLLARNPDGTYRMTASRFVEGSPLGPFRYHGTRPDDPNDIYPHEHRRELRANRVFCAWLNHDDSRALNTLDMLVGDESRRWVKHYMFDFGSLLGSSPRRWSGVEYMFEGAPTWKALVTFGLWIQPWQLIRYPRDLPPSVGRVEGDAFDPEQWKPEYPNPAFDNMRPDDAFWAARIVAAFSDEAIGAIVRKAQYSDPRATDHITSALIRRRDTIARVWLNGVNPLVNFTLSAEGTLTFENAAVAARAATPGRGYTLRWSRFDNATGGHEPAGLQTTVADPVGRLPDGLATAEFVAVTVRSLHPELAAWNEPVHAYFRREGGGWRTVGLERNPLSK